MRWEESSGETDHLDPPVVRHLDDDLAVAEVQRRDERLRRVEGGDDLHGNSMGGKPFECADERAAVG